MAADYISAFANFEGGCVYFGIEDTKGLVQGIDISSTTEKEIERVLETKITNLAWWAMKSQPAKQEVWIRKCLQKGEHWGITFCNIENLPNDKKENKIIEVYVNKLPGGVFTECPKSYYLQEGRVKRFGFEDWIIATHKKYGGSPSTRAEMKEVKDKLDDVHQDVIEIKHSVQPIKHTGSIKMQTNSEVTNITEWELNQFPIYTETSAELERHMMDKKCVILKGLVGTGKSELALRYCYHYSQNNPSSIVWMIKCSDLSRMETTMRDLYQRLMGEGSSEDNFSFNTDMIPKLGTNILKTLNEIPHDHILLFDDVKDDTQTKVDKLIDMCIKSAYVKAVVTTQRVLEERDNTKIIHIQGFSETEALEFLEDGHQAKKEEKRCYTEIASIFSRNIKGLHIARTYMKYMKLSPQAFLNRLKHPLDIRKVEQNKSIQQKLKAEPLFESLIKIIRDIHTQYKNSYSEEIFEMLLMLQFLQVDRIPVEIFSYLQISDPCFTDAFIFAVQDYSLGQVMGIDEGLHDKRLLNSHDVVGLALKIYMELYQKEISSKNTLQRRLLNAFFLLLDKDNISKASLKEHTLFLPHARYVVEQFKNQEINLEDVDLVLKMIYLNDLVGYTTSFIKMDKDACEFYDQAKHLLFRILNEDEQKFDESLRLSCVTVQEFTDFDEITKKSTETLKIAVSKLLLSEKFKGALKKLSKEFVLKRKRNSDVMNLLFGESKYDKLTLSEEQYNDLCCKGYAIPFDDLWRVVFYDLLTSLLHTFGRRLFYMPARDDSVEARVYCSYLHISYQLSLDCFGNRSDVSFNLLSSTLIERSIIQSAMDPNLGFDKGPSELILKKNLIICKEKINENKNYVEFGTLKMCSEENNYNKVTWIKQLTRIYRILVRENKQLKSDCLEWAENLAGYRTKMKESTVFPSLMLSLGELYFAVEEFSKAESCFERLLPKVMGEHDTNIKFTKHERRACINYVDCRISQKEKDLNFHKETLAKLMTFKIVMKYHTEQLQDFQQLENTLQKLIAESGETPEENT